MVDLMIFLFIAGIIAVCIWQLDKQLFKDLDKPIDDWGVCRCCKKKEANHHFIYNEREYYYYCTDCMMKTDTSICYCGLCKSIQFKKDTFKIHNVYICYDCQSKIRNEGE